MREQLEALRGRSDLVGPALRAALVDLADGWLADLLGDPGPGVALVAVGAYGRRDPAFGSDLDLVLVHDGRRDDVAELAQRIWYRVWDSGVGLDHSVRTVRQTLDVADGDLKAALGLLDARHVAGDAALATELVSAIRARWRAKAGSRLPELAAAVAERARQHGEVAFLLEPDVKEARGGLRDVQALRALAAAWVADAPSDAVLAAADVLLDVRGELHRRIRSGARDRLVLQEQDAIAAALGRPNGEALAREVADASRTIAWAWDTTWHRTSRTLRPRRWGGRKVVRRPLADGVVEHDGEVALALAASPSTDPVLVLRAAQAAAAANLPLAPHTLDRLVRECGPLPQPWPAAAREAFVGLLGAGPSAVPVVEALDQTGLLVALLPEWQQVRSKPQRNPYHRYTVDRHLVETATTAAGFTRRVARPDLLLVGGLLHDLGKGWPGDHSVVGAELAPELATRLGFASADAATLATLVRHHLLLPDTATRRDIDDPATAEFVAEVVGDLAVLELLAVLAEADGLATGPTAWSNWKAQLIDGLVAHVRTVLGGERPTAPQLTDRQRTLLARAEELTVTVEASAETPDGGRVVVTAPDQVGLLAVVTGVVALRRLDVRRASAVSDAGRALTELEVATRHGDPLPPAERLRADVRAALAGELALQERLAERERAYPARRRPREAAPPQVLFDDTARGATIVEVRAPDALGLLHRIVAALSAQGLDVRTAIVSTLGLDAVDSFYVRGAGGPLADGERAAVRSAVLAALDGTDAATGR